MAGRECMAEEKAKNPLTHYPRGPEKRAQTLPGACRANRQQPAQATPKQQKPRAESGRKQRATRVKRRERRGGQGGGGREKRRGLIISHGWRYSAAKNE